jgi:hypothetical protein
MTKRNHLKDGFFHKTNSKMKTLRKLIILVALAVSAASYAQTVPTTPTSPTTPTQDPTTTNPASTNPTTEKKAEFNAPQSPVRPSNTPSEDTLIKGQRVGGAVIQDTLVPSRGKKNDKMSRRKSKKASNEADTTASSTSSDTIKKP